MRSCLTKLSCAVAAALAIPASPAGAQWLRGPSGAHPVRIASGLRTPTAFAFGAGKTFVADDGSQDGSNAGGGVFVLEHGRARRVPGSPRVTLGLTWHRGTLYVSAHSALLAWRGWNGSRFTSMRTIYAGPAGFTGFSGLGFGADGRLYAGVELAVTNDHSPSSAPYAFDVLSFNAAGGDLRVVARGLRQPFQMAFPPRSSAPFVSVLGQDQDPENPPDYIVRIRPGENFGFPGCNWITPAPCRGFTRPLALLPPHASPMGLGVFRARLYMALYGGVGAGPEVASMPLAGGRLRPLLIGFAQPIVALGIHGDQLFVGELNGQIFRIRI